MILCDLILNEFGYKHETNELISGKMIDPYAQPPDGKIIKFERLGGLLNSYRRVDETFKNASPMVRYAVDKFLKGLDED